jgi:hypothetical protein
MASVLWRRVSLSNLPRAADTVDEAMEAREDAEAVDQGCGKA